MKYLLYWENGRGWAIERLPEKTFLKLHCTQQHLIAAVKSNTALCAFSGLFYKQIVVKKKIILFVLRKKCVLGRDETKN